MTLQELSADGLARRRLVFAAASTAVLAASQPLASGAGPLLQAQPSGGEGEKPYDLVIQHGKVIDPSQNIEALQDVAIRDGKIARLDAEIPASQARQVVDARGKIVCPGLIDLHAHVFPYVGPYGIEPDPYCVRRGVTTVVDAGTSGALTFPAFRNFVIERAATRIRPLLHIVAIGLVAGGTRNMGELEDLRYCDPKMAAKVATENRDLIVGFKVRCSEDYTGPNDLEGVKRTRAAADEAGLPFMIHIGSSYTPLPEFLALMKRGDVVTHSFNGHPHGLLDPSGKLLPEVLDARARGVLFDVGHGAGSFSFAVMEQCLKQHFPPDTISSDLYSANIHGPVFDLLTTLSKFMALGLSLNEVIARATVNAAAVFNFGEKLGTLAPGTVADVSVLDLQDSEITFTDSEHKTRTGRQKLVPVVTVRNGGLFYPTT
jgi:dihydroorotase